MDRGPLESRSLLDSPHPDGNYERTYAASYADNTRSDAEADHASDAAIFYGLRVLYAQRTGALLGDEQHLVDGPAIGNEQAAESLAYVSRETWSDTAFPLVSSF